MKKIVEVLSIVYLVVILVNLYFAIVVSVYTTRYVKDLMYFDAFTKVTCENVFFGKSKWSNKTRDWYCTLPSGKIIPISFPGGLIKKDIEFDTKDVFYNSITSRAYRYTEDDLFQMILNRIILIVVVLILFILLSIAALSNKIIYKEDEI